MNRLWNFVFACVDLVNAAASVVTLGFYWPDLDMKIRVWHTIRAIKKRN